MRKQSFLKGAFILSIAGIIVKVLGAIYRIPLANIITSEGMGYYGVAYTIYFFLVSISIGGLPTAISKLVSERIAIGDRGEAHRVFKVSFTALFCIGIVASTLLLAGAKYFVNILGNPRAYYAMIAVAPALFFVPLMSAFRGYFQGMQNMIPTALSQIVEQLGRVVIGFILAIIFLPRGLEYAAAGAAFGATSGAVAGACVIYLIYLLNRRRIMEGVKSSPTILREPATSILYKLFAIAIPIILGSSIISIMNMIDLGIVMRRLQYAGYSLEEASSLYGQLTQMAATLVNFPQVIMAALAASLVPAISESTALNNLEGIRRKSTAGIKAAILIGLPAAVGLSVLAQPIMSMLYPKEPEAWEILRVLAFAVIFISIVQTATGILQGIGRPMVPVKNMMVGALFKLSISYTLTGIKWINVKGAALGSVIGFMVAAILNYRYLKKETGIKLGVLDFLAKPIIAVMGMALGVTLIYKFTVQAVSGSAISSIMSANAVSTLVSIAAGALIYGIILLAVGGVTSRELEMAPGGVRLSRVLRSLGLLRK